MRKIITFGAIMCLIILIIPTMLVLAFQGEGIEKSIKTISLETPNTSNSTNDLAERENLSVAVFRAKTQKIEEVDFEEYIIGVVASEMPAEFSLEALKAQSLTARTYIINQLLNPGEISLPNGAVVTDTVMHQVYRNEDELRQLWGKDYNWAKEKITKAVQATRGQIITFEGKPITAAFFSTSNGYTENSEEYWQNEFPYLRSVASPWDSASPRFTSEKIVTSQEFFQKLGVKLPGDGTVGEIISRTKGGRVATVKINGKMFTGREIREKLDLDSSDFQWKRSGGNVVIQTKGWGHGVGMSQWGANGMAKEGKSYQEIVKYYYKGVEISAIDPFIANLTVAPSVQ